MNSELRNSVCILSELVERHYALVYRYAYRLSGSAADAEDLTQHTFLTAQTKLSQLRHPALAKAWLCTIVRNAYLKSYNRSATRPLRKLDRVPEPADEPEINGHVDAEALQDCLNALPEAFRTPLILYYFEDFTYKEIAAQIDVPIGTVMSRLARAKSHLRRALGSREARWQTDRPPKRVLKG